ncbi:MAG: hypothetical protein DRP86_01035 [Candidatus Neomarinimicrobiota bacterium]|nr:MAG: hypothetical protein DRP86_01035 [Candidatus Neomarinimicrobiota bacterium]
MKPIRILTLLLLWKLITPLYAVSPHYSEKMTNYHSFRYLYSMSQSDDRTYFASNNGVIVYSHLFHQWKKPMNRPMGLPDTDIRTIYYHRATGYLWAAVNRDLYVLFGDAAFQWEKVDFDGYCKRIGSAGDRLFADTYDGIVELDPYTGALINTIKEPDLKINWSVSGIEMDLYQVQFTGEYFIDTDGSVVGSAFVKYPIAFSVYGNSQNLWMGTLGNGLYTGGRTVRIVEHQPYGLLNDNVTQCLVSGDQIYIGHGIDYNGLDDRNGWTETCKAFQEFKWIDDDEVAVLGNQSVRGFMKYRDTLLVITDHSIIVSGPGEDNFQTITPGVGLINTVHEVVQQGHTGWIIAETGVFEVDLKELYIRPIQDIPFKIQTGLQINNHLYLGSYSGIMVFEVSDSNHLDFKKNFINIRYGVAHLTENGEYVFWSDDVFIMKGDPRLESVQTLPVAGLRRGIRIRDIACDTSYVWVGTNRGLYSYNLKTEQTEHITREEGLCSNNIQTLEISGNILYIGTDRGLTRYEIYK